MSTELSSVPCKDLVCKSLDQLESSNANHRGTLPGAKQGLILNTEGLGEIIPRLGPTPGWRSVLKGTDSDSIIIVLSCNFYASEIPSDDNPASTACGPVSAQGIAHTVFLGATVHIDIFLPS